MTLKRIFTLILAFAMVLGTVYVPALADDVETIAVDLVDGVVAEESIEEVEEIEDIGEIKELTEEDPEEDIPAEFELMSTSDDLAANLAAGGEVVPQGTLNGVGYISAGYINGVPAVFGEASEVVGVESFEVKLFDGETHVGTATLVDDDKVLLNGVSKSVTWHAALSDDGDTWWSTEWTDGTLNIDTIPDNAELWVDGVLVDDKCEIQQNINDLEKPIVAAVTDADGNVQSFVAGSGYLNGTNENAPVYDAALQTAVSNAAEGANIAMLRAGTYKVPTGKSITITGEVDGVVFDNIGACNMGGASVTFNNVTFDYLPNTTYTGLQHSGNLVYNNCTFNGTVFLYGTSETFNNCTFNVEGDAYNVWTYGAKIVEFNGCTFNSTGKSVLIYSEDANLFNDVAVTDCDFIATGSFEGKAAIEMDSSLTSGIKLTIDDATTATGFDNGNVSGNSLWNNKKGNDANVAANNDITVTVNNEVVLKPAVMGLSGVGTETDPYLIGSLEELIWFRDSVNTYTSDGSNQYKDKYVKLTADIDLNGENWTPIGTNSVGDHMAFLGTFDGGGHTISNLYINADGDHLGFFARVGSYSEDVTPTVKNITFENVDVSSNTTTGHGGSYVGGVIANAGGNSVVSGVKVTGDVYVAGYGYVGGIVGHGYPDLTDCHVVANDGSYLQCYYWCGGGIIGYAGEGGTPITNCSVSSLDIWSAYGGAAAIAGFLQAGNKLENVSASNVEITSASDYYMGYIAGNGEESTMTDITIENVTATANGKEITATDAVAKIVDKVYFNLSSAIEATAEGGTVTLIRDITEQNITVKAAQAVLASADPAKAKIVDLNNKTVTGNFVVESGADVIIKNGTINSADEAYSGVESKGNVTLENVNITSLRHAIRVKGGTTTINSGTYMVAGTNAEMTTHAVNVSDGGKVIINGGTFKGAVGTGAESGQAVMVQADSSVEINGGTFSNGKEWVFIVMDGGSLKISNGSFEGKFLVNNGGSLEISGGTYTQDPTEYLADGVQAIYDSMTELYSVVGTWKVGTSAVTDSVHEDTDKLYEGETVDVTVKADGSNFSGATWKLDYDENLFKFVEIVSEADLEADRPNADGTISGWVNDENTQDSYSSGTTLAVYRFKAIAQTEIKEGTFSITEATVGTYAMSAADSFPAAATGDAAKVTILLKDFDVTVNHVVGEEVKGEVTDGAITIPYDNEEHKIVVETEPDATVYYKNGEEWTTEVPVFTNPDTYTVTYKVDVPDGYDQTAETPVDITVTIGDATDYKIEVAKYVTGYKLILVHTNLENAYFKYDDSEVLMLDVTAAGYNFKDEAGNVETKEYEHVYGYVVPVIVTDEANEITAEDRVYKDKVAYVYGGTTNETPAEVKPYDYNINCDNANVVDLADVIYITSVYNAVDVNMVEGYMKRILKADAAVGEDGERDKQVNNHDITPVKTEWQNSR